jgi:hypothetical protein
MVEGMFMPVVSGTFSDVILGAQPTMPRTP